MKVLELNSLETIKEQKEELDNFAEAAKVFDNDGNGKKSQAVQAAQRIGGRYSQLLKENEREASSEGRRLATLEKFLTESFL